MDPTSMQPLATIASVVATSNVRNNNIAVTRGTPNHPTYKEMIRNAIATLKERKGSSKRAIAKYIEKTFTHLPTTHSALLSVHLKRLKSQGVLIMVKKSYKLARSNASSPSAQPKRGRPCKPKPNLEQAQPLEVRRNTKQLLVALGLEDEPASSGVKRGPGRPPKERAMEVSEPRIRRSIRVKTEPERHPKPKSIYEIPNGPKRGVGRPPKNQSNVPIIPFAPTVTVPVMPIAHPRGKGHPKKINAATVSHSGDVPQAIGGGRGRGRGISAGSTVLFMSLDEEQATSDSDDLRRKLRYFQSKVRESLVPIKGIIQELETLASIDLN
ncbi:histone H1-like [Senna tora]|uniref:Histone H1-like n=1 Tax=Senna tora TaxID=362788 RepID=A0A834WYD0_9FABA|nr:histone H1-like [Senna tora]